MDASVGTPLGIGYSTSQEGSTNPPGQDHLVLLMQSRGIPVTRETYLALSHPDAKGPLTPEQELELPEELRLNWSRDPE